MATITEALIVALDLHGVGRLVVLRGLGYRLWWHIAPVFNPGNRLDGTAKPFPGLMTVNAPAPGPNQLPPALVAVDAASCRLARDGR